MIRYGMPFLPKRLPELIRLNGLTETLCRSKRVIFIANFLAMKKILLTTVCLLCLNIYAQEHFSGVSTSQRTGIINAGINPAELANLETPYDIHIFSTSFKASSNRVGFKDLFNDSKQLKNKLFAGSKASSISFDGEIYGPSVAFRYQSWGFAVTTKAYTKLDVIDVNNDLGSALTQSVVNSFFTGSSTISNDYNQRFIGTSWGEIGFSAAKGLYEDESNRLSAGATFKLLFPGSYANFGADKFTGTINNEFGRITLTNAVANLNIAYSGNLGEDFTQFSDYAKSLYGKPNGVAADIGVNYRLKDMTDGDHYKLSVGLAIRNMGGMKFKSANNASTNYVLAVQGTDTLELNQFQNVKGMKEVERLLLASGYLNKTSNDHKDFKVSLPTIFSGYADVRVIPSFYVTLFTQQRLKNERDNDQISSPNVVSVTPRYVGKNFEGWIPFSYNEISGVASGLGLRAYGFYVGSGSVLTALLNNSKQADVYIGYSFKLD